MTIRAASKQDWTAARIALLAREKAHTKERDALARARRDLPALPIDKAYRFETRAGSKSLVDLFDGRSQLMVYHFMFGADWDEGCTSCSFWADNMNGIDTHLAHRDVTLLMVSSAPLSAIEPYRERMGWSLNWVSCAEGTFNRDMNVSFTPEELASKTAFYNYRKGGFPVSEAHGLTVFSRDGDQVFLTYGTFGRGVEGFNSAYQLLDLAPMGRDEDALPYGMAWLKRRDEYESAG